MNRCLIVLVFAVLGCSREGPFSPLPGPPPAPGNVVHEGVVYEVLQRGDPRPVPNLRLVAWNPLVLSRVGATRGADVITDELGRFRFSSREALVFLEMAPGSPVKFICPSHPFFGSGDLYVVDASWSGDRAPAKTLQGFGSVQGRVFERVGTLFQPAVGATVVLDNGSHMPPTVTDASGFYAICSPGGADFLVSVAARKDGYRPATASIIWGWDYVADLFLERN